jgi:hypothetical protein
MKIEKRMREYYDSKIEKIAIPPMPQRFAGTGVRRRRFFGSDAAGAFAAVCAGV